jgi:hypothetical protein
MACTSAYQPFNECTRRHLHEIIYVRRCAAGNESMTNQALKVLTKYLEDLDNLLDAKVKK